LFSALGAHDNLFALASRGFGRLHRRTATRLSHLGCSAGFIAGAGFVFASLNSRRQTNHYEGKDKFFHVPFIPSFSVLSRDFYGDRPPDNTSAVDTKSNQPSFG
jgi:hypothetical protein